MRRSGSGLLYVAALAVCGLFAAGSQPAKAGYNVTLGTVTPSGPNFTWTYNASITANQEQVVSGNFFRIYDVAGYVLGSAAGPAGWVATAALLNSVPPPNVILVHGDDPTLFNITFTYTGAVPLSGPVSLGNFLINSTYGGTSSTIKDFVGQSTNTGTTPPSFNDTRGDVTVAAVPEPLSLLSASVGVILLGIGYVRRSHKPVAV
jgi:hypothetical protein